MSYNLDFSVVLGSGSTGLTLAAQLVDSTGDEVGDPITDGFVEIGSGNYLWHGTIPDGHQGGVVFREDGDPTVLAFSDINPLSMDSVQIEEGVNLPQAIAIMAAALAGKLSITAIGSGQSTVSIKGIGINTERVSATVNTKGERTAVTLELP